jgi:hypothetical protein
VNYLAMIIVIPLCLGIGVAAPFIADSFDRRSQRVRSAVGGRQVEAERNQLRPAADTELGEDAV